MDRQNVCLLEELILGDEDCTRGLRCLRGHVLTPGDQIHAKGAADSGHFRPNPPKAKNAERLSAQLRTNGSLPAAGPQRVALRYDVARTGQDKGPGKVDRRVRSISG